VRRLGEIFRNEVRSILRSKMLYLQVAVSVVWMLVAPYFFTGDGTASGLRQMTLHYSLGGVAAMMSVTLLVAAAGSIARERAERRLALTLVRPVRYLFVALGKILAYVLCGALVLAVAAVIEYVRQPATVCRHVYRPLMPPVMEEAELMYADYMANTNTPPEVRQAKKAVVLRLLANRARDRFDTISTNATWSWKFDLDTLKMPPFSVLSTRFRFSTSFDQREEVRGSLRIGVYHGAVSNITQAVIEVPLEMTQRFAAPDELEFRNLGRSQVMLRPRRDVELLVPADAFGWNLLRAYLELVAMLALLVAFGVFLGSALGRPSALFTAIAVLFLSEMAPSVIDNYADELESDKVDAIGLAITRATASATRPLSSLRPLEALSLDECVESDEVARVLATDFLLLPLLLAFLSALVLPRKQDES